MLGAATRSLRTGHGCHWLASGGRRYCTSADLGTQSDSRSCAQRLRRTRDRQELRTTHCNAFTCGDVRIDAISLDEAAAQVASGTLGGAVHLCNAYTVALA